MIIENVNPYSLEPIDRLKTLFIVPSYYIKRNGRKYVLCESRNRVKDLFYDSDGSILGTPHYRINFFVFPMGDESVSLSDWYVESIREWLHQNEETVIIDRTNPQSVELDKYLLPFWAGAYAQWLVENYSDIKVCTNSGRRVYAPRKGIAY